MFFTIVLPTLVCISLVLLILKLSFGLAFVLTQLSGAVCSGLIGLLVAQKFTLCNPSWMNMLIWALMLVGVYLLTLRFLPCTGRSFKFVTAYVISVLAFSIATTLAAEFVLAFFPNFDSQNILNTIVMALSIILLPYAYMLSRDASYQSCSGICVVAIIDRIISCCLYFAGLYLLSAFNPMIPKNFWVIGAMAIGAIVLCVVDACSY